MAYKKFIRYPHYGSGVCTLFAPRLNKSFYVIRTRAYQKLLRYPLYGFGASTLFALWLKKNLYVIRTAAYQKLRVCANDSASRSMEAFESMRDGGTFRAN